MYQELKVSEGSTKEIRATNFIAKLNEIGATDVHILEYTGYHIWAIVKVSDVVLPNEPTWGNPYRPDFKHSGQGFETDKEWLESIDRRLAPDRQSEEDKRFEELTRFSPTITLSPGIREQAETMLGPLPTVESLDPRLAIGISHEETMGELMGGYPISNSMESPKETEMETTPVELAPLPETVEEYLAKEGPMETKSNPEEVPE